MLERDPKGRWLCKGSAARCQCIPFLGLKKHARGGVKGCTFWGSKLVESLEKKNHCVGCRHSPQTGEICMQSASWLTNMCLPEVFNTWAQPGLTRHGRILSECESNLYGFKESLHIMSQGEGVYPGQNVPNKEKKKNFPCKWKIC